MCRKGPVQLLPSGDLTADTPGTPEPAAAILEWGVRAMSSVVSGRHNVKIGRGCEADAIAGEFRLLGVTDPTFNSPCIDRMETPAIIPPHRSRPMREGGLQPNIDPIHNAAAPFVPALLPYDLSRGGNLFAFHAPPISISSPPTLTIYAHRGPLRNSLSVFASTITTVDRRKTSRSPAWESPTNQADRNGPGGAPTPGR